MCGFSSSPAWEFHPPRPGRRFVVVGGTNPAPEMVLDRGPLGLRAVELVLSDFDRDDSPVEPEDTRPHPLTLSTPECERSSQPRRDQVDRDIADDGEQTLHQIAIPRNGLKIKHILRAKKKVLWEVALASQTFFSPGTYANLAPLCGVRSWLAPATHFFSEGLTSHVHRLGRPMWKCVGLSQAPTRPAPTPTRSWEAEVAMSRTSYAASSRTGRTAPVPA